MKLSKAQSKIFECDDRFRVVVAGRRFGKTTLSLVELLRVALDRKTKGYYVAPTYKSAKEIAWQMLNDSIPSGYISKKHETELKMTLRNGSTIALKGADNYDSLRGVGLDFIVLDEFADMHPDAWFHVLRPTLSDTGGRALFIGSPKGRNHFYDLWTRGIDGADGWDSFQYTTLDGGYVPTEEIESAKSDLDSRTFQQEYEAQFVNYEGIIYYNFNRKESVKQTNKTKQYHIGIDMNINPMSAVVMGIDGATMSVLDEVVIFGSNTAELMDELHQRGYTTDKATLYPDPACRQRKTSAGGKTDLSIMENAGYRVRVRNKHTAVRDRINAVNSRLLNGKGERHLFVDPKCNTVIRCLERHIYKEGTSQPEKDSGFDHMNDALGYAVDFLYPIKKSYEEQPMTRWT